MHSKASIDQQPQNALRLRLVNRARELVALSAIVVWAIAYNDTLNGIVDIWTTSRTYIHGFAIVPISLVLIWKARAAFGRAAKRVFWPGLIGLAATSLIWWAAHSLGIRVAEQLAAVAFLPLIVLTVFGAQAARTIRFPLLFLIFAVPFGDILIPALVDFTAKFAVTALTLTGIPVIRDAQYFSIPSGDFEVARACSGVRFLIASIVTGTLFAYMNFRSARARIAFVLFSAILPIIANGIRVYAIVLVAHFSSMKLAVGVDHLVYGWVFFAIILGVMVYVGTRFRTEDAALPNDEVSNVRDSDGAARSPLIMSLLLAAVTASLAIGPAVAKLLPPRSGSSVPLQASVPEQVSAWRGPITSNSDWHPIFVNATAESAFRYESGAAAVDLVVIQYAGSGHSSELAHSGNIIMDEDEWLVRAPRLIDTGLIQGPNAVRETFGTSGARDRLVWYWYDVNGRTLLSLPAVKFRESLSWISGDEIVSTFVAISAPNVDGYDSTAAVLREFLDVAYEPIRACITVRAEASTQCYPGKPAEVED